MSIKSCVSLYSLQEDYLSGKRDLRSCIEAMGKNGIGVDDIELLPDQMPLPGMRENDRVLSMEVVDQWNELLEKNGVIAQSYGAKVFTTNYANRQLTMKELIDIVQKDIKMAAQLGFRVYRTGILRKEDIALLTECIPLAEDLNIQIGCEIHTPRGIHTWYTQEWLEVIQKTGSPAAGFVPDFAIFSKGLSESAYKRILRDGGHAEILDKISEAHAAGEPLSVEDVKKMGGNAADCSAVGRLGALIYDDPEWLREVLPYSKHIHGKFYEINKDGFEKSIDYENAIRVLVETGWDGYISSEYEGQRDYFDIGCDIYMDPVEQVAAHQKMIRYFENKAKNK